MLSKGVTCKKCKSTITRTMAKRTGGLCEKCKDGQHPVENMLWPPSAVLSLDDYLALVRRVPLPSAEQRRNFVAYVATAHSWYKHLPAYLPGAPFYFYVDKSAGCDWVPLRDGSYMIAEREKHGFHYSDLPTAEYRTRFGYLSYSCAWGTAVLVSGGPLALPRDKAVAIPGENAQPCYLPEPILKAGRVELTAVIHPNFDACPWGAEPRSATESTPCWEPYRRFFKWPWKGPPSSQKYSTAWWQKKLKVYWPPESGGQGTLKKIIKRYVEMCKPEYHEEKSARLDSYFNGERKADYLKREQACRTKEEREELSCEVFGDPILHELILPERLRQRAEMLKTIDRVCTLIDGASGAAHDRTR